jgi:hypothetical protein
MIPEPLLAFLHDRLPAQTLENRLIRESGRCYIEFGRWMSNGWAG